MEVAPFFEDVSGGPDGGIAHWIQSDDGVRIRVGHWPLEGAKGTILFFAGRNECVEKYGIAAGEMRDRGYAAVGIDWRGQGLADRLIADHRLGHVDDFADYQRDVTAILAHIDALELPKPYFLVGHSMGGCIGLEALHRGLPVAAACFTAPMWGVLLNPVVKLFARGFAALTDVVGGSTRIAPGQRPEPYITYTSMAENGLTSDPEMYDFVLAQTTQHPELAVGAPTTRWVGLALAETKRLSRLPSPNYACLTFLGTDEDIVDPAEIHDRMARWDGAELVMLQDARHEVMVETPEHRRKLFDRMAAHFDAHL